LVELALAKLYINIIALARTPLQYVTVASFIYWIINQKGALHVSKVLQEVNAHIHFQFQLVSLQKLQNPFKQINKIDNEQLFSNISL
jgi:hypothetical protein